jgi:precorrin-2 dehydrogenase/sirohydrochlorin ferrochelatase
MIPILLDPRRVPLGILGNGSATLRRLNALRLGGAQSVQVFADNPVPELRDAAGEHLRERLPAAQDLALLRVLWIAEAGASAEAVAEAARRAGVLVSTEDRPDSCDFHSAAEVRRKNLLLTVSTGGAAPGLASLIRQYLEGCFGKEWAGHVDEVGAMRAAWRTEGVTMAEAARRIAALVAERGWLTRSQPN